MHRFKRATGPIAPISILRGVDARIRVAAGRYIPLYDPKRLSRLNAVVILGDLHYPRGYLGAVIYAPSGGYGSNMDTLTRRDIVVKVIVMRHWVCLINIYDIRKH